MIPPENAKTLSTKLTPLSRTVGFRSRRGSWRIAKDLPSSFRYAAKGIAYGFSTQRNFRIHLVIGALVFGLGLWLQLSTNHLAVLVLTVTAVLALELINTAIEAVVDLSIGRRYHPLARIAKDCSAASVLVASLSSLIIAILLISNLNPSAGFEFI